MSCMISDELAVGFPTYNSTSQPSINIVSLNLNNLQPSSMTLYGQGIIKGPASGHIQLNPAASGRFQRYTYMGISVDPFP